MATVVVGGGIFGLVLAHELQKHGGQVRVLEAAPRAGGTIRTFERDGFVTEAGPNGFLDNEPATLALVDELGLGPRLRRAEPSVKRRFVYSRGALHELPGSPGGILRSAVLPPLARLRLLAEPLSRRGAPDSDETLASFARRHLGRGAADTLIDAMQSGIYAGDPERLSLQAVFPRFAQLEREHRSLMVGMVRLRRSPTPPKLSGELCTFDRGLEPLVEALADRLGDGLRLGVSVDSVARHADGWRLQTSAGAQDASTLVLCVPAHAAADLLRPLDGALAGELEGIEYAPITVVHLGFDSDELPRTLAGFGFLVPEREGRRILGAIFVSSIFPWRAPAGRTLLSVMVGGARHPERAALADAELVDTVCAELKQIAGVREEPSFVQVVRWPRAIPQYNVGHLARLARVQDALATRPGLYLGGNAYRGVGINDCVRNAQAMAARVVS